MKALACLVLLLSMAGCAGLADRAAERAAQGESSRESRYVSTIEQSAARRNMEVIWLHPPKKRSRTADDDTTEDDG